MIKIVVTSEIVECTRLFRKDRPSITFLKRIKKLHQTAAETKSGPKPRLSITQKKLWRERVALNQIPVKINITHIN